MIRRVSLLALASACSTPPPQANVPCVAHFAGDVVDTVTGATCGAADGDAGRTFSAHVTGASVPLFDVSIALPAQSGTFSSETEAASWTANATFGDAGCAFLGGSAAIPQGSYTLSIDEDGHGTLVMILYIQAPPTTNCGPHDVENVELTF